MAVSTLEIPRERLSCVLRPALPRRRLWMVLFLALLAIAVLLRIPYLSTRSIWLDEAASWRAASFGFARLVRCMLFGNHVPTYFFVLKGWAAVFGESLVSLRGLSIVFGVITVAAMYQLGCELYIGSRLFTIDRHARVHRATMQRLFGLTTALLAAVSPFQINSSIEARPYSMGAALTALGGWALLKAIRRNAVRDWLAFGGLASAGMYTHHLVSISVASQFAFLAALIGTQWRQGNAARARLFFKRALSCGCAIALAYIPCLCLLIYQHRRVQAEFWAAPVDLALLRNTLIQFISPVGLDDAPLGSSHIALGAALAFGLAIVVTAHRGRYGDWSVLAAGLLPFLLVALVSLRKPVWEPRFFRFTHLYLLAIVALATWRVAPPRFSWRVASAAFLLILGVLAATCFWRGREIPARQGMREAIRRIADGLHPGEIIVVDSLNHYLPARYYAPQGVEVKLLDNASNGFWGPNHVVPDDRISDRDLRQALKKGVWSINHLKLAHQDAARDISPLGSAVALRSFASDYDHGVPPWPIVVNYCVDKDVAAREVGEFDAAQCVAVDDWDLQRMCGLVGLRRLRLDHTTITDRGLAEMTALINLTTFSAAHTQVSDSGLKVLSALTNLETLTLDGTMVTDAGIPHLLKMPHLLSVSLRNTGVTPEGIRSLAAGRPELTIAYDKDADDANN